MPLVGFAVLFLGGTLAYAGFLGIKPTTVVRNIFEGKKMPARVPLDPRSRPNTDNTGGSGGGTQPVVNA